MRTQRSREGYLLIDHRASPGLPADVARSLGLDPALTAEGQILEAASLTCAHCKTVVMKNPLRQRPRERCAKCDHYVCDLCHAAAQAPGYAHLPYDLRVELTITAAEHGQSPDALIVPATNLVPR
jgi:hypothetical protein